MGSNDLKKNRALESASGGRRRFNWFVALILAITIVGLVLRVMCCFWGYPYHLHTDERAIINNVIDMLRRHSWEANVYNRPDQFEIKCDAILFFLISRLKYHSGVIKAFRLHEVDFYVIARLYTVFWGTLMIPLMALFTGKTLRNDGFQEKHVRFAQLIAAGITTFLPIFVNHSAYATPDIPLSFFSLLIAYLSLFYLESGDRRFFCAISVLTGISITIKYPAAVMCLYIAFIAIYRAVRTRDYKSVFPAAGISIGLILATMFVIAPNLFTNVKEAVCTIITEARPNHLGQDSLGFGGNLRYYFMQMINNAGYISVALFVLGALFLATHRKIAHAGLTVGLIYWICLSVLSLHWERWGMPMYTAYVVLMAIGCAWILSAIEGKVRLSGARRLCAALTGVCIALMGVNVVISGLAAVKSTFVPDARTMAMEYCDQHGITAENAMFEGFVALDESLGSKKWDQFQLDGEELSLIEEQRAKRYYVLNPTYRDRYYAEPERYAEMCAVYRAVERNYKVIYKVESRVYKSSALEVLNIPYRLDYLLHPVESSNSVYIYDLQSQAS